MVTRDEFNFWCKIMAKKTITCETEQHSQQEGSNYGEGGDVNGTVILTAIRKKIRKEIRKELIGGFIDN